MLFKEVADIAQFDLVNSRTFKDFQGCVGTLTQVSTAKIHPAKYITKKHCILTKNSHQLVITYHILFVLWILHCNNVSSLNLY